MTAPLVGIGALGELASLGTALGIGLVFGWFLERGGLGNARKLAGQFYLTDFTVLKVMFSAILTAMLGLFWLGWAGVVDLSQVYVPETFLLPQLVGGLIFGVGFVLAGLCPGTSCVAAVTGRRDGLATVAGLLVGVFVFAELFPVVAALYERTSRGSLTLPQVFGLSHGTMVFAVVCLALGAFAIAERVEQRSGATRQ